MICVSYYNDIYHCANRTVAEQFAEYLKQTKNQVAQISNVSNEGSEDTVLKFDIGGMVCMSDRPVLVALNEHTAFEFRAQHWTALKFEIKQALKTNEPFIVLDGRWIGLVLTRAEAQLLWADLEKNSSHYTLLEKESIDRFEMAVNSLRETGYFIEKKTSNTEVN